jgi:hypothetical protein
MEQTTVEIIKTVESHQPDGTGRRIASKVFGSSCCPEAFSSISIDATARGAEDTVAVADHFRGGSVPPARTHPGSGRRDAGFQPQALPFTAKADGFALLPV